MKEVYNLTLGSNSLLFLKEILIKEEALDKMAVVFPGRRPRFYLRQYLAQVKESPFFPPAFFSINEFIEKLKGLLSPGEKGISSFQAVSIIFRILQNIQKVKKVFEKLPLSHIIHWSYYLYSLLEELEVEMVERERVETLKKSIQYDNKDLREIAEKILLHLTLIWDEFRKELKDKNLYTRGMAYREVAKNIEEIIPLIPWEKVYFTGFFLLNPAEEKIIYELWKKGIGIVIWEGEEEFEYFKEWKRKWGITDIVNIDEGKGKYPEITLFSASDVHTQMLKLREKLLELLEKGVPPEEIGIVLPETSSLFPLLEEVISHLDVEYNLSMGYPLVKFPLYTLFLQIKKNLERAKKLDNQIYFPLSGYLSLFLHPYIKNLSLHWDRETTRIILHQLENFLTEKGELWINPQDIEKVFPSTISEKKKLEEEKIREFLSFLHQTFLLQFLGIKRVEECAEKLKKISLLLLEKSIPQEYPFSYEYFSRFLEVLQDLENMEWGEGLEKELIFDIILASFQQERIPFSGTPLKGLQVLGMLEARNLSFPYLFILDANEGILPGVKKYDPFLPPDLRKFLGLPDYHRREELYHYQFRRLLFSSQSVHIFYLESEEDKKRSSRSRFIEEIVWEKEKEEGKLDVLKAKSIVSPIEVKTPVCIEIQKNEKILEILNNTEFSPSMIDTYIKCPLKFYFRYILKLEEGKKVEEEWEGGEIGSLLHSVLHQYFSPYLHKQLREENFPTLDALLSILREEMKKKYLHLDRGFPYLLYRFLELVLRGFHRREKERIRNSVCILSLEEKRSGKVVMDGKIYKFTAKWDRIEKMGEKTIIIDYKTQSAQGVYNTFLPRWGYLSSPLSSRQEIKEKMQSLQLPLYLYLWKNWVGEKWENLDAFYYPLLTPHDRRSFFSYRGNLLPVEFVMEQIFIPTLTFLMEEITDPDIPFSNPERDEKECSYCPYLNLCLTQL